MKAIWRNDMKKLFAVLLAAAVLLCLFAGCREETEPVDASVETTLNTEAPTEAPTEEIPAANYGKWRVALLTEDGNITDQSAIQAIYEAASAWCEERGAAFTYYAPTETTTGRFVSMTEQAIADGCNVLLMKGKTFVDAIKATAPKNPGVRYIVFDVTEKNYGDFVPPENVYTATFREEIPGFMAGYAAVKLGYRHLAFLGAVPRETIRYGYGFVQGVNAAAVELDVEREIAVEFAYGNSASPDSSEVTVYLDTMFQKKGVEICFVCGPLNGAVCEAALRAGGAKVIGADCDQATILDPVYGDGITVTSAVKSYEAAVKAALRDLIENNKWRAYGGKNAALGVISGDDPDANYVCLAPSTRYEDGKFTEEDYAALVAALLAGDYTVSDETVIAPTVEIAVNYLGNLK